MIFSAYQGKGGQEAIPLITGGTIHQCHHCAMHAIIAFGKDILERIHEWLLFLEQGKTSKWEAAKAWFQKYHINVDITQYPFCFFLY